MVTLLLTGDNKKVYYYICKADAGKEEYFKRPVQITPLQIVDYKRTGKIVQSQPGELDKQSVKIPQNG